MVAFTTLSLYSTRGLNKGLVVQGLVATCKITLHILENRSTSVEKILTLHETETLALKVSLVLEFKLFSSFYEIHCGLGLKRNNL